MIAVDASAVLEVLLRTRPGERIEERIFARGVTIHVPHLIDLEILQVLRRYTRSREMSEQRAAEALQDLADFPLIRYPHDPFLKRIWELRNNVTAYDAAYLSLAETLGAPLLTRDAKLASVPGHNATVEVIR